MPEELEPGLARVPAATLDELVRCWAERRPGAKRIDGSTVTPPGMSPVAAVI